MFHKLILLSLVLLSAGCRISMRNPDASVYPDFKQVYTQWSKESRVSFLSSVQDSRITFSFRDAKLVDVLRHLANECGVSVVCAESLDSRPCTVEVRDETVSTVMSYLAKRYEVQITNDGRFYYLGKVGNTDKTVLVSPVFRLKDSEWKELATTLLSENGRVSVVDGVLICCDYGTVTGRLGRAIEQVHSSDLGCYIVQLWVLSLERDDEKELGINTVPSADVSAVLSSGRVSTALSAALAGKLQFICSQKQDDMSCNTMFLLNDGAKGSFVRGVRVPIPRTAVSNQGTVTTIGYEYVQTGLQVEATIRSLSPDRCRLVLDVSNAAIQSYVGSAPQTLNQQLQCSPVVSVGGVYLLGCMDVRGAKKGEYLAGVKSGQTVGSVQVWSRVYRITDRQGVPNPSPASVGGAGGLPQDSGLELRRVSRVPGVGVVAALPSSPAHSPSNAVMPGILAFSSPDFPGMPRRSAPMVAFCLGYYCLTLSPPGASPAGLLSRRIAGRAQGGAPE